MFTHFKPIHLGHIWIKYGVDGKYFGGVNSFNREDFRKINGFPSNYWGWGGEDDKLYDRVVECNLTVINPKTGKYKEMEHNKPTKKNLLILLFALKYLIHIRLTY
mgnify:CR=1 FL=1